MRKIRKGRARAQKRMMIFGVFALLMFLSVGYATFTTNITLNAKGNVHPVTTINELKKNVVSTGDGLYLDIYENDRYIYKGANPNNYLTLNNDTWRIIAIEPDNTLKVVKADSIGSMPFDLGRSSVVSGITEADSDVGTRYSTVSTDFCYYASGNNGCKVWGSKDTMRNSSGVLLKNTDGGAKMQRILTTATTYDLPDDEAYVNVYLNGGTYAGVTVPGWYDTWSTNLSSSIKAKILSDHSWNVGLVSNTSGQLLGTDIQQEKALTWQGRVGLLSDTDYVKASSNTECTGVYAYKNTSACYNNGATHNFLRKASAFMVMSPYSYSNCYSTWYASTTTLTTNNSLTSRAVYPVLYLSSSVVFTGDGTSTSKYAISV